MAIGLIAHINVVDGKGREFEDAFTKQAACVRENEPGNQLYRLFRSRENPNAYVVMEIYESNEALDAHANSEHFKASRPVMLPLRDGKPRVTILDAI
ncbi:MAG: antibiotic biosynthesis monooxygenase family protein [Phenylobacterium sp.]|uniref:putative quinol monooxygenase n=1 Tax=Phenylobacterium sp. TaxID=1871053 RepID=UPI0027352D7E|nr:antibiotic biosynthesis monooxygenase family protein [Phenylobacterium sp.]MDP3750022.1 antibiotic biosynthesis monooxygenase family protein [Phenylobacterium sp.]